MSGGGFGAVDYSYDAAGNAVTASGGTWWSMAYTSFNLPDSQSDIGRPAGVPRSTWQYDENHQRIRETRVNGAGTRTTRPADSAMTTRGMWCSQALAWLLSALFRHRRPFARSESVSRARKKFLSELLPATE